MARKQTYGELEKRIKDLEKEALECKRIGKALRESEDKYHELYHLVRLIADNVPDLIWAKDIEGRFIFVNQAMCDKLIMCGTPDKAIGKTDMYFCEQERLAGYNHTFGEICIDSDTITKEEKASGRFLEDGLVRNENLILDVHKAPFLDGDGEMIGTVGCGRDVTKEKEIETALQKSEKRYSLATDAGQVGVWDWNVETGEIYLDPKLKAMLGYADHEIKNHLDDWGELVHPEDREPVMLAADKHFEGLSPQFEVEHRMLHKDGGVRWFLARGMAMRDENGRPYRVIGTDTDITDRKRAEEALKESEEKSKAQYKNIPVPTYTWQMIGKDLVLTDFNDAAEEITKGKIADLLGVKAGKLYRDMPDILDDLTRCLSEKTVVEREMAYPFKTTGEKKTLAVKYAFVPPDSVLVHTEDITLRVEAEKKLKESHAELERRVKERTKELAETIEVLQGEVADRKRAEGALKESDAQKEAILDASIDRIRLVDKEMRVVWANRTTTRELNMGPEDVVGRSCYDLLFERDAPCPGCPSKRALESGEIEHAVIHQPNAVGIQGESYWEDYAVPIKNESGEIVNLIQVTRNITENKKLEAELRQAHKMEAIGTLAGGIAHDFNNLLMGVQGRTSLMLLDTDSSHPHYEHLKGIEGYVRSAADLTKQLLGLARGGKYEVRPTDLNEIVRKSSEMFGRTRKEITIHRKLQEGGWAVEIDRGQIEQVLLNLYVNAWQSMPGGGDLYLQTENVTLDKSHTRPFGIEPGRFVKISVTDTGVGMDRATRERIFEPFFTTKEMGRGTGLGLASVYGIIKNHGGMISVYSEKGHGATFTIHLPASEKGAAEETASPERILKGEGTVLLVDDEEMILDVGKQMLERMGYHVLLARGGKEAVEVYEEDRDEIEMVILDMIMPEMGGGETYDKLKEINPEIKVLLSSGYSVDGKATEILDRGCDGFLQKPFNVKDMSHKVRAILEKE